MVFTEFFCAFVFRILPCFLFLLGKTQLANTCIYQWDSYYGKIHQVPVDEMAPGFFHSFSHTGFYRSIVLPRSGKKRRYLVWLERPGQPD